MSDPAAARWPSAAECLPVPWVDPPHPATLPVADFEPRVRWRFQRRSGPGGQHRNKVSTGAFATDAVTGLTVEATESRSQRTNRRRAQSRLRLALAVQRRTRPADPGKVADGVAPGVATGVAAESAAGFATGFADDAWLDRASALRRKFGRRGLRINSESDDFASAIALLLDDLHRAGGQPSLVGPRWSVSTGAVLRLVRQHPPAWALLTTIRHHHGRAALR